MILQLKALSPLPPSIAGFCLRGMEYVRAVVFANIFFSGNNTTKAQQILLQHFQSFRLFMQQSTCFIDYIKVTGGGHSSWNVWTFLSRRQGLEYLQLKNIFSISTYFLFAFLDGWKRTYLGWESIILWRVRSIDGKQVFELRNNDFGNWMLLGFWFSDSWLKDKLKYQNESFSALGISK